MLPGEKGPTEAQVEEWLRRVVAFPDKTRQGRCVKLVLRHLNVERKPQGDVETFFPKFEEGAEDDAIDPLLLQVADAAQKDANDLNSGVQTYCLYAYFELDPTVPRKVFRVSSADVEIERDVKPSEPATAEGLLAQTMRHMEAIMKTATVQAGYQTQTMQREMQRLAEINENFMKSHVDMMVLVQDTLDGSHRRRLEERDAEHRLTMKDSAFQKLEALLPIIANRIAGKQLLPEEDRSHMLMASMLENMSPEQQQQLLGLLNESQRLTLGEILREYELKKAKWLPSKKTSQPQTVRTTGSANALPPPHSTRSLQPSRQGEDSPRPHPLVTSPSERMSQPETPSNDPVIRRLEADGKAFADRFRDMLQPPTKPPTDGEPR